MPALLLAILSTVAATGQTAPERVVTGNVLRSTHDPAITLRIDPAATYAGADRWTLYGVADCEIHVFVETAANRVTRLYWIQFEAYLPGVSGRYEYQSSVNVDIGGRPFVVDHGVWATAAPMRRPDSDRERVLKLLTGAGYDLPAEWMSLRLVHVPDAEQRKELMIIYAEDLASTGHARADLADAGKAADYRQALQRRLLERLQGT